MSFANRVVLSKAWYLRGINSLVQATGYSMHPLIKTGMWLVVQPCSHRDIKPGDIALFHQSSGLVAHRIIFKKKQGNEIYLGHKGDNAYIIVTVPSNCLLAKVTKIKMPQDAINLERDYWQWINRLLGKYLNTLWRIKYWLLKEKLSGNSRFYLPFAAINQRALQFILRAGCWRGIDKEPTWSRLACNCITPQFASSVDWPTEEIDWNNFLKTIRSQNIHGLGYAYLKQHRAKVPGKIISNLAKSTHSFGYRNHKILAELSRLVKALKNAGVEVILLKGAALLASRVYSDPSHRNMRDIDVLVKKEDLLQVETTLESLGFLPCCGKENDNVAEWYRRYFREITYYKSAGDYNVDVHWSINEFFNIPYHELKNRSKSLDLNGVNMFTLSPEDTLLHLCLHAVFQDCLTIDFRHWADFVRIAQIDLNWSQVVINARRYRVEQVLYVAFYLGHKFLGIQIPLNVLDKLRPACSYSLLRWLKKQENFTDLHYPILETSWRLKLIRGWHDKIHYLTGVFFPSREELSLVNQFNSDSLLNYLKYFLLHKIHILMKTLSRFKLAYERR